MPNRKMNAEQRRAYMERAIDDGGSVLHEGRVIISKNALPSLGDLARTAQERSAALDDIAARRRQLDEEEARLRTASTTSPSTDEARTPAEASSVVPSAGPATAKKNVKAGD